MPTLVTATRLLIGAGLMALAVPVAARVTSVNIDKVEPAKSVVGAVAYEIVSGTFAGELDPADPHNMIITDIEHAPRNARGRVEYRATFRIARPVDPAKASGVLFYDVPNRGTGSVAADPDGHIRVISGWQGDIEPYRGLQTISVPVAHGAGGRSITGPVLARIARRGPSIKSVSITGGFGRPVNAPLPVSLDTRKARLWREDQNGTRTPIAPDAWAFANCKETPFPGKPDPRQLCLREPFNADAAYTLVYEGKDPLVLGIGFAATRDLVAFLRDGKADDAGTANPAGSPVRWAVASGTSQSGNFLKSFVHLGFNAAEDGKPVFDGINPNIAARLALLNLRFGVPGGAAGAYEAGSEGTLWWSNYSDRTRHRGTSSLLARCTASQTCPKIIETLGSAEFWGLRLSPGFVGTDARADIVLPANVRRYYFPSTAHGGSMGKGFAIGGDSIFGTCLLPGNPNPSHPQLRVALKALVDWVREGKEPPASSYPTLAAGDLVEPNAKALGWPSIPGAPAPDGMINTLPNQDFGKALRYTDLSGVITRQPPRVGRIIPLLVPRVDADGNETAGVRSLHLRVPIGTYTGWNVETSGINKGKNCGFVAGFIPFARSRAERMAKGDPRPSLEERYTDHAGFVARVREVASQMQADGWLFPDDAARIVKDAEDSSILK